MDGERAAMWGQPRWNLHQCSISDCIVTPGLDSPFGLGWPPQNSCILSYSTRKGPRTLGPCGGVRKQEGGGHDTRCPAEESREHSRGGAAVSPAPYQPA